jgi:ribosomal protein L11 methyltransferase
MEYIELKISAKSEDDAEIYMAHLADFPFDSFTYDDDSLLAYAPSDDYAACAEQVEELLRTCGAEFCSTQVEQQNWNSEWENNFEPVNVNSIPPIRIRGPHHAAPAEGVIDVVISPRMSFGTGHHNTTALMVEHIANIGLSGLRGLDMGCGTGVLSIAALKCGAESMMAVDIDDWACDSCRDSMRLSGVEMDVRCGSMDVVAGEKYDFVLANINRNILVMMMPSFAEALSAGGRLLMSGFLQEDVPVIEQCASEYGFSVEHTAEREGWMVVQCKKR